MAYQVLGIDHIFITVGDLDRSQIFYDQVMCLLGFKKGANLIGDQPHVHYFNPFMQYTIRPAKADALRHDPMAPGLHHICFQVADVPTVDEIAEGLEALGIACSPPQIYPEYGVDYYAIYFKDPDGIELEIVNRGQLRDLIADHWEQLEYFEDPLSRAGLI